MVAEKGFAISSGYVLICSGLFAIFRADTKNCAMFDPGFCGYGICFRRKDISDAFIYETS